MAELIYIVGWEINDFHSEDRRIWLPDFKTLSKFEREIVGETYTQLINPRFTPARIVFSEHSLELEERVVLFPGDALYHLGLISPKNAGYVVEDYNGLRIATNEDFNKPVHSLIFEDDYKAEQYFMNANARLLVGTASLGMGYNNVRKVIQKFIEITARAREAFKKGELLKFRYYAEGKRDTEACTLPALLTSKVNGLNLMYEARKDKPKQVRPSPLRFSRALCFLKDKCKMYRGRNATAKLKKEHPNYIDTIKTARTMGLQSYEPEPEIKSPNTRKQKRKPSVLPIDFEKSMEESIQIIEKYHKLGWI